MSFWARMDSALLAALQSALGSSGSYQTLILRYSEIGEQWQPDKWTKPALIVYSRDVRQSSEEHGGNAGATHAVSRYAYAVTCVVENDSYAATRQDAQTMQSRITLALREWPAILAVATAADASDQEQGRRLRWQATTLRVEPRTSRTNSGAGTHWGVVSVLFEIESRQ